jgi:hypothetical protein
MNDISEKIISEPGKIGYLVLYLMGAPIGLLLLLWVILGDNLFTAGGMFEFKDRRTIYCL